MKLFILAVALFALNVLGEAKDPSSPSSADQKLLPGLGGRRKRSAVFDEHLNPNAHQPHYPHVLWKIHPNLESEDSNGDYETKPEVPQKMKCAKHFVDMETLLDAAQFYLDDVREFLKTPSGHRYLMEVSKRYLDSYLEEYRDRLHGGERTVALP